MDQLRRQVIFHDGRIVQKPSPALALLTLLWFPIGLLLSFLRIAAGSLLPMRMVYHAFTALGVRVTIKGNQPPPACLESGQTGVLFVCSHRTLLDPIFLSTALGRPITAVTYRRCNGRSGHLSRSHRHQTARNQMAIQTDLAAPLPVPCSAIPTRSRTPPPPVLATAVGPVLPCSRNDHRPTRAVAGVQTHLGGCQTEPCARFPAGSGEAPPHFVSLPLSPHLTGGARCQPLHSRPKRYEWRRIL